MQKKFIASIFVAALALSMTAGAAESAAPEATPEVVKLGNGVEVTHLKKGTGVKPTASDHVKVHYKGTLADGTVFDSSYARGEPITFPLSGVISCWTTGVAEMSVGGHAKLFCPSATAYGSQGAGGVIKPNTDLFFEVELLDVVNK